MARAEYKEARCEELEHHESATNEGQTTPNGEKD
jgi:hypothetical protein